MLDPARERAELEAYLGDDFDELSLWGHEKLVVAELECIGDERDFFHRSEAYLYDLTAFAMAGTKDPYHEWIRAAVAPGARLLDVGCGIGSDGLALMEDGYRVTFAEFDNPSTRYLRWRLERRGVQAPVADLDEGLPDGPFDLAYAFDVVEHLDDPAALLAELEARAGLVLVNLLEPDPKERTVHRRELPVDALVRRAARQGLVRYRVLHDRSHLVLYRPGRARGPARARAVSALLAGRARRRADRLATRWQARAARFGWRADAA